MTRYPLAIAALLASACASAPAKPATHVSRTISAPAPEPFADEIAQFAAADRTSPPRRNAVLFVGSSTIRMWPAIHADFNGTDVIQRGFGGSELGDVVHYAPRIVLPYKPRLIMLYAGDNDLAAGKSPEAVFDQYRKFVRLVERALPATRIAFISIKPSIARWSIADKMRAVNAMVKNFAATDNRLLYVDVYSAMLGPDGTPRKDLFIEDGLHMNATGYQIWRTILRPVVRRSMGGNTD